MTYQQFLTLLAQDMRTALKARDTLQANTLKSLMARLANAEAVPVDATLQTVLADTTIPHEAPRKQLNYADAQQILQAEITELNIAINHLDTNTSEYKAELLKARSVLSHYLKK